jgi:hypothetical protein
MTCEEKQSLVIELDTDDYTLRINGSVFSGNQCDARYVFDLLNSLSEERQRLAWELTETRRVIRRLLERERGE